MACEDATFDKQDFTQSFRANQYTSPQVDILVIQDISASMRYPLERLKGQLNIFTSNLGKFSDYHFAVLPLQNVGTTPDLRDRYILASDCTTIRTKCLSTKEYSTFNESRDSGWYSFQGEIVSTEDTAFKNISGYLKDTDSMRGSGFLRDGALLVIIVLTNGEETTDVAHRLRSDGKLIIDYNNTGYKGAADSFLNLLTTTTGSSRLKDHISQIGFYSISADRRTKNCHGAQAFPGKRYQDMALRIDSAYETVTNGENYNICSSDVNNVLSHIGEQLKDAIKAVQFDFIALKNKPILSSIIIKKNGEIIPNILVGDEGNSWSLFLSDNTAHEYQEGKGTSYFPVRGNYKSGYFIKLYGDARYSGNDKIEIIYNKE